MRVVHYHLGKDGGAERFFVHLVNALARRGVEQTLVIRRNRVWRDDIDASARIIESNFRNLSFDRVLLPLKVKTMARRQKPDALISWATRASRLMPDYNACIKISRLGDYPTSLSYFRHSDVLVCNTPGIGEHVRKMGWTRGIEVISNFTNTDRVLPIDRAMLDTPRSAPLIMAMGRFVSRKRFAVLTAAMAKLPGVYLWLAGDGEERDNVEKVATKEGVVSRVRFLGWRNDVRPYVAAANIFVMPSSHEPLGNVILEAWAQQKPVVSSRCEGPSWYIREGENGLFADVADPVDFARAIERLISDSVLASKIAAGGRETLMKQFSEEGITSAYMDLIKRSMCHDAHGTDRSMLEGVT